MGKFKDELEKIVESLGSDLSKTIQDYGIFLIAIAVIIYIFKRK